MNSHKAKDFHEKQKRGNSQAEQQANDAEPHQARQLPIPAPTTPEEEAELENELRALALSLRYDGESDEEAIDRVSASKYLLKQVHDPYWPFYHVERRAGRIVLTLNTAHPFYERVYKPIADAVINVPVEGDDDDGAAFKAAGSVLTGLELMLFSLARAQEMISGGEDKQEDLFDNLRIEWSKALSTQLELP